MSLYELKYEVGAKLIERSSRRRGVVYGVYWFVDRWLHVIDWADSGVIAGSGMDARCFYKNYGQEEEE